MPTLFGTTENAVYTQLYTTLSARSVYNPSLSSAGFQRLLLWSGLSIQ
ncbi:hypothetical protein [Domibacillus enclensis]|nr:hypothetical protein [Domibacillus enclensis]